MFSTCKAGIMPYAHGVLHMTKEDSIFSPDTVTDTAKNCPEIGTYIHSRNPKEIHPTHKELFETCKTFLITLCCENGL